MECSIYIKYFLIQWIPTLGSGYPIKTNKRTLSVLVFFLLNKGYEAENLQKSVFVFIVLPPNSMTHPYLN